MVVESYSKRACELITKILIVVPPSSTGNAAGYVDLSTATDDYDDKSEDEVEVQQVVPGPQKRSLPNSMALYEAQKRMREAEAHRAQLQHSFQS